MIDLSGQNTLVIGGINRLAAGVANTLEQVGASVAVGREAGDPLRLSEGLSKNITISSFDLAKPERLAHQFGKLPPLHTVVVSPAYFAYSRFLEATVEEIERAIHENFEQATMLIQAAGRHMIQHHIKGSIIVLSSVTSLMPHLHNNLAGSTLAALEVVAKMAAVEFGKYGIRVNIIAAGWLDDERSRPLLNEHGQLHTSADIPLGKVGQVSEVGNVCCFLASPLSSYMTGAILPVDGGYLLTKSSAQSPYGTKGMSQ